MRVLLTGAGGQLARELAACVPPQFELAAMPRAELDLARPGQVARVVRELAPQLIVNAAAYTAVDAAEEAAEQAFAVNAEGVAELARAARGCGARLLHLSTDFVFDGAATQPYQPGDPVAPISAYGRSKLAGEGRLLTELEEGATVVRTAWLFSSRGRNFVTTMLRLMAEREQLSVVDDQRGSPTWAGGLARVLWQLAARPDVGGIWHWSDAGECSWFEFAQEIARQARERDLLSRLPLITPITSADYPTPAARPRYSVLDSTATRQLLGIEALPWQQTLGRMLDEMMRSGNNG